MLIIRYLTFALIVFTSTAFEDECVSVEKITYYYCKTLEKYYKQDNGALADHVCGCVKGLLMGNYKKYCRADEYDFDDAPNCALAFKTDQFKKASDRTYNKVSNFFINILFKNELDVCYEENEETIVDSLQKGLNSDYVTITLETVFRATYDYDVAEPLIRCYSDMRNLAKTQDEDLNY